MFWTKCQMWEYWAMIGTIKLGNRKWIPNGVNGDGWLVSPSLAFLWRVHNRLMIFYFGQILTWRRRWRKVSDALVARFK